MEMSGSVKGCQMPAPSHTPVNTGECSTGRHLTTLNKKRLSGDTQREAASGEVKDLRGEAAALKEALAELAHGKSPA